MPTKPISTSPATQSDQYADYLKHYESKLLTSLGTIPTQPTVELCEGMWVRLVDWVYHCCKVCGIQDLNVYFTALDLIRRHAHTQNEDRRDLQLTAVASIFIAAKLLEMKPLKMEFCLETLGHNKYTRE